MCFINDDYDWCAEVGVRTPLRPLERPSRCQECHRTIAAGELAESWYQQESEECLACQNGECGCANDEANDDCCQCEKPDFGNTFDYDCCEQCSRLLEAVEAAELEAGCRKDEAKPPLEMMAEYITNNGPEDAKRYFKKAAVMFPELKTSGWLGRTWKGWFV